MKLWVDPPSGWKYGFPQIWDSALYPDIVKWLKDRNYPEPNSPYIRMWPIDEKEIENEDISYTGCTG